MLALVLAPDFARGMCDVIPGAVNEFRGALGALNRPFAIPGEAAEEIAIRVRPGVCDSASQGFGDRGGLPGGEDDYFVTVLFEPPAPSAPRNAVVLGAQANLATCQARVAAAAALPNGGTAECRAVPPAGRCSNDSSSCDADADCAPGVCVALPGDPDLSTHSECVGGSASGARCTTNAQCPSATCEPVVLTFRFPDTEDRVGTPTDDRTLTGPATIAVTPVSAPLPVGLATSRCADPQRPPGLVACIDELYERDGTCGTADVDPTFGHFTALPPANDYQALCTTPDPPCTGAQDEVRFTVDKAGNALIPMDYRGVLVVNDRIPVPRIVAGKSSIDAFLASPGAPVDLRSDAFLASFSPGGHRLPPIFTPLRGEAPGTASLFGSVDAPAGVIRVHRHRCEGGPQDQQPCTATSDCGVGGSCEALYEFSDRLEGGVGPVLISSFEAEVQEPVALDGLLESPSMFAFVTSEAIDGVSLNADADATDPVLRLRDRSTGEVQSIGSLGSDGRAVSRVRDGAFRFPAVAVEDDVSDTDEIVAFLEPEPLEDNTDLNANGERVDTILRVYRVVAGTAQELTDSSTPSSALTADAAPLINGRSAVVSDGQVFFRTSESEESPRETTTESVADGTTEASNFAADPAVVSSNGRYVAFVSPANNLTSDFDDNSFPGCNPTCYPNLNVYVHDRFTGGTILVSKSSSGAATLTGISDQPAISADGRFVAFRSNGLFYQSSPGAGGARQIYLHDRDENGNGVFDGEGDDDDFDGNEIDPGEVSTYLKSCRRCPPQYSGGAIVPAAGIAQWPSVSGNGRILAFSSEAGNLDDLLPPAAPGPFRPWVHDVQYNHSWRLDVDDTGAVLDGSSNYTCISSNGRYAVFDLGATVPIPIGGLFLLDLDANENGLRWYAENPALPGPGALERISVAVDGAPISGATSLPAAFGRCVSDDGRFVTFGTAAPDVIQGDTNQAFDVFVRDRAAKTTIRVSVAENGEQGDDWSGDPTISTDGRFVAFSSHASTLAASDPEGASCNGGPNNGQACTSSSHCAGEICRAPPDAFLADLATGHVRQLSVGHPLWSAQASVSAGGVAGAFVGQSVSDGAQSKTRGVAPGPGAGERSGDDERDDTILRVIDTTSVTPGAATDLCPAGQVAVGDGKAAFLRPEAAGISPDTACAQNGADLNEDSDQTDSIVHLWNGSAVSNLRCAATEVALSSTRVAALVSEADEGVGGTSLNGSPLGGDPGDSDKNDRVLFVRAVADSAPGSCAAGWTNTGLAGDAIAVAGDTVVVAVPERSQGGASLNGDGDTTDRVLRIYRAVQNDVIQIDQAVEDFVVDGDILAFRTRECAQGGALVSVDCPLGGTDLNGDGDPDDDVLQAFDLASQQLVNSESAVVPCPVEACDPRFPYRVSGGVVTFVTLEADQGDLNGDGHSTDLIKQAFNVKQALQLAAPAVTAIASTSTGVCTTTGDPCASDSDCGAGRCYVPPGRCDEALVGSPCSCSSVDGTCTFCGTNTPGVEYYCQPSPDFSSGTCHAKRGPCAADDACTGGEVCTDARADIQRLFAPIATGAVVEGEVLVSSGRCVLECGSDADCEDGDTCDTAAGTCTRERGSCRTRDDCEGGLACTAELTGRDELVTAAAADQDGDALADPLDNCPAISNPDQADVDADGLGDLCDAATCGDGTLEPGETCDDGDLEDGDGCNARCVVEQCRNGLDDDLDGRIDTGGVPGVAFDPGCSSPDDVSERASSGMPCDDGLDDDGDGLIDYPSDPGCRWWSWRREDPKCDNGLDDDGDGGTDWDGVPPDPNCAGKPWRDRETTGCGLGFEIAPLLAPLLWLRRRRRAAPREERSARRSFG